jgi:hypothetical protein
MSSTPNTVTNFFLIKKLTTLIKPYLTAYINNVKLNKCFKELFAVSIIQMKLLKELKKIQIVSPTFLLEVDL